MSDATSPDSHGGAGLHTHFRGPFADGPPPEALEVHFPDLDAFGVAELRRMVVVNTVLLVAVLRGLVRKVLHWRSGTLLFCVSTEVIDGFFVLGPTFVKLGQIVASSPGLFPDDVSQPAQKCLQEVPPFRAQIVRQMIKDDLGKTPTQIFESFDDAPLSAASVGQVHACVLPDGREAVVKLQRPDIAERMNLDLRINYKLAKLLMKTDVGRRANAVGQVRDLYRVTNQELNTPLEAFRQSEFRRNIHHFGDNELVYAPEVYWDYCGPHMICMERMRGVPMDDFAALEEMGFDSRNNLRRGMKAWLEALCVHGPFHGDLHAGNIWALEDGRNCFLDFGIMGELDDDWRQMMRDILYTFMIDQDFRRIIAGYKKLGVISPDVGDDEQLASVMHATFAPMMQSAMQDLNFGEMFQQSLEMAEHLGDISAPEELTLFGKQFLYFERYVKGIAPDYMVVTDPYLVKNIFPEAAAARIAELQAQFPDRVIDPDETRDESAGASAAAGPMAPSAPAPTVPTVRVLPDVHYDGPTFPFLSADWFAAVDRVTAEQPPLPADLAAVVVNVTVVDAPTGSVDAHLRGGRIGLAHTSDAATLVTVPHDVASALIVDMDPAPVMEAMMAGRVTVEGDISRLIALQASLIESTPDQLLLAATIRALTR